MVIELGHLGTDLVRELLQIDIGRHAEGQVALIAVDPTGDVQPRLPFLRLLQGKIDVPDIDLLVVGALPNQQAVHDAQVIDIEFPGRVCRISAAAGRRNRGVHLRELFTVGREANDGVFNITCFTNS